MAQHVRRVNLDGVNNFRDLGGYCTEDGFVTSWGRLYRSGSLAKLSENDLQALEKLNIRTIVDLRCKTEASFNKDILPANAEYFHCPLQDFEVNPDGSPIIAFENTLAESYERMISKTGHLFCKALNTIIERLSYGAVVFHCSAGKDRTGTMAATILKLLRVCDEDIIADYQVTSTYNRDVKTTLDNNYTKDDFHSFFYDSSPENLAELYKLFSNVNLQQYLVEKGIENKNVELLKNEMRSITF